MALWSLMVKSPNSIIHRGTLLALNARNTGNKDGQCVPAVQIVEKKGVE